MLAYLQFPNWNPVILDMSWMSENAALRWYGFTYIVSFAFGYFALWYMQRQGYLRVGKDDVVNYMIVGVIGVFAGGRIGEVFFYQFDRTFFGPEPAWDRFLNVFAVWHGGMSFHGGLIGVTLAVLLYSYFKKQSFFNVMDGCTQFMPFGFACVRFGNFVGGDLYGRVITDDAGKAIYDGDKLPWYAMKFPTDPEGVREIAKHIDPKTWKDHSPLPVPEDVWATVEPFVPGRYPSQIPQLLLEGLLLWVTLIVLRRYCRKPGMLASLLCVFYGAYRFPVEYIREPEPGDPMNLGFTIGQNLCLALLAFGVAMFIYCWKFRKEAKPYTDDELRMRTAGPGVATKAAPQTERRS